MKKQPPVEVVISRFGIRPLARDLGIDPSTITRWRKNGLVPAEYHVKIIELSRDELSADDLVFGR